MRLRVATYNVHGCVGTDGRRDVARVAEVVRELDADIIALQEVVFSSVTETERPVALLSALSDMQAVSAPVERRDGVRLGNVLLTTFPIARRGTLNLDVGSFEPRRALDVRLSTGEADLRVIATHLGLRPAERRRQVKALLSLLRSDAAALTLLMGDFNEWFLRGRPLRWLEAHFGKTRARATFPSRFPVLALDRIWSLPRTSLLESWVHRSARARAASDHLPVIATVTMPS